MDLKRIVSSRVTLYVCLAIAITNLLGYASMGNSSAVIIMALSGLLTSYFTRNMVIVLLTAIVCGAIFSIGERGDVVEGLENKTDESEQRPSPPAISGGPSPKVDREETQLRTFNNLNQNVDSEGMKALSADTERVFEQHKEIMTSIDNMKPVLSQANNMLKTLGSLTKPITSILEKLIPIVGSNPDMAKESPLSPQQLGDLQKQIQNLGAHSKAIGNV